LSFLQIISHYSFNLYPGGSLRKSTSNSICPAPNRHSLPVGSPKPLPEKAEFLAHRRSHAGLFGNLVFSIIVSSYGDNESIPLPSFLAMFLLAQLFIRPSNGPTSYAGPHVLIGIDAGKAFTPGNFEKY
jgi:hypothetical protein